MHNSQQVAIEITHLTKTYQSKGKGLIRAVDDLSLSIEAGRVFGFLGANGAGKTTTIKMLCGLIKPDSGTMRLNGYDVHKERGDAMRQIGAVLEGTRNVYWRMSALENVMYFGRLKGRSGSGLRQEAEKLIRDLDLWERRSDKVRTFSRGMQQKVAIACALISDPSIILLDEPTLGLDVKAARTVKEWVAHLSKEYGKTIILTTHHLDMAQELCDRVAIINKGKLVTNSPTNQLLDLFRTRYYQIKVHGRMNGHAAQLPDSFIIEEQEEESTVLSGTIETQEGLYQIIDTLRDMGYPLHSIVPTEPNLEEIFMNYIQDEVTS